MAVISIEREGDRNSNNDSFVAGLLLDRNNQIFYN